MDIELSNFRRKLTAMRNVNSFVWLVICAAKVIYEKGRRKFFRSGVPAKTGNELGGITGCDFSFHELNFLNSQTEFGLGGASDGPLFEGEVDWKVDLPDVQDLHLLHRFGDVLLMLINAQTMDERLEGSGMAVNRMNHWIEQNPPGSQPGWHPYTLSERLINWILILHLFRRLGISEADAKIESIYESIIMQGAFLSDNFELHLGHHNHLINNARALLTVATVFPSCTRSVKWSQKARNIFEKEWPHQILSDGVHAEQSLTYHLLLTRNLWEFKMLYLQNGWDFPFDDDLEKMLFYGAKMVRPDGTIPFLGHITPDWHWKELVGLIPVWGFNGVMMSSLGRLYKTDWKGADVISSNSSIFSVFHYAGIGLVSDRNLHAVICSDPRGLLAQHGDQNQLGIEIWLAGTHLIRDTGLDSYNLNKNRSWFEGSEGQSSFTIDGLEPVVSNWRRRQLPKAYYHSTGSVSLNAEKSMLCASHTGYLRLSDPTHVGRSLQVIEDNVVVIVDEAKGRLKHEYVANFHFGWNTIEKLEANSLVLFDSRKGQRFLFTWTGTPEIELVKRSFAEAYGRRSEGNTCIVKTGFRGSLRVEYTIAPL